MRRFDAVLVALAMVAFASGCGGDPPGEARAFTGPITGAGGAAGANEVGAGGEGGLGEGGGGGLAEGGSGGVAEGGSGGVAEGGSGGLAEGGTGGIAEGGSGGMATGGSGGMAAGGSGGSGSNPLPPGDWVPTGGPTGIMADHLFVTSSGTLLAGTFPRSEGVPAAARSTDGGVTWSRQAGEVPGTGRITEVNGTLFTVQRNSTAPFYSLYGSTDDGLTWTVKVADWTHMHGPVAGPNGLLWTLKSDGTLRSSADGGTTWSVAGAVPVPVPTPVIDFYGAGGRLFVEIDHLVGSNDGVSWTTLTDPGDVQQLVAHGGSHYAYLLNGPHMRSDDGGLTWVVDSPHPDPLRTCPFYVIGTSLYTVLHGHVFERGANDWSVVGSASNCPAAAGGGALWLGLGGPDGEVIRWDPSAMYPTRATIQSAYAPMASLYGNDDVLIGSDRFGTTFRSVDDGASWERMAERRYGRLFSLGGPNWLAETGTFWNPDFPADRPTGIALSTDDGATWWSGTRMGAASFVPAGADILAAGPGGLYRSANGGFIWTPVQTGTSDNLRELWRDGSTLYVVGFDGPFNDVWAARTWRSTDDGVTFSAVADARFSGGVVRVGAQLVALGTTGEPDHIRDIWHSHDDGVTWQPMNAGLPDRYLGSLVSNGTDLFLLELGYHDYPRKPFVWHSADAGLTWAQLGSELPGSVTGIVPTTNGLFIAVEGAGVWKWSPTP